MAIPGTEPLCYVGSYNLPHAPHKSATLNWASSLAPPSLSKPPLSSTLLPSSLLPQNSSSKMCFCISCPRRVCVYMSTCVFFVRRHPLVQMCLHFFPSAAWLRVCVGVFVCVCMYALLFRSRLSPLLAHCCLLTSSIQKDLLKKKKNLCKLLLIKKKKAGYYFKRYIAKVTPDLLRDKKSSVLCGMFLVCREASPEVERR